MLAVIRPDSINGPLFLHVLGAIVLVGGLVTGGCALLLGARGAGERLLRLGYRTLLFVALPGYILMRIGAQWTESRENLPDDLTWLDIGYIVADGGAVLLLVALIVGGLGVRRLRARRGTGLLKASMAISLLLVVAYGVAVWAMGAKPA